MSANILGGGFSSPSYPRRCSLEPSAQFCFFWFGGVVDSGSVLVGPPPPGTLSFSV